MGKAEEEDEAFDVGLGSRLFLRQRGAQGGISTGLWHALSLLRKRRQGDGKELECCKSGKD